MITSTLRRRIVINCYKTCDSLCYRLCYNTFFAFRMEVYLFVIRNNVINSHTQSPAPQKSCKRKDKTKSSNNQYNFLIHKIYNVIKNSYNNLITLRYNGVIKNFITNDYCTVQGVGNTARCSDEVKQ